MAKLTGFSPAPIPGPRGLPLVGFQVNALRLLADPIRGLTALRREHGDVVAVLGQSPALVCAFGAARNREVLSNAPLFEMDDAFFVPFPEGTNAHDMLSSLPFQRGEKARKTRRLMMPAFQKSALDGYATDIVAETARALDTWPVGQTADVAVLVRELVRQVAVRCIFGLSNEGGRRGLGEAMTEMVDLIASPLTLALPWRVPGLPYARCLAACDAVMAQLRVLVDEKRRSGPGKDALALMIHARDEDGGSLSDLELLGAAATLYVAGHDTQAKTLTWTLFLLEQHPEVLAALMDELDAVLGDEPPTPAHLPRLPLLDRVIKESMRVLISVPTLFLRVCQEPASLGGHALPRLANVVLSPFITHHDPALFPEPNRFLPARWESIQPSIYEYLPFGAGARLCVGASFATQALRLMLPMILKRYRPSLAPGARVSFHVRANLLGPKYGLPMQLNRQDRAFARQPSFRGDIREIVDLPG
ncbi:MAG: cytochrome P450 [Byssovorax sp.]